MNFNIHSQNLIKHVRFFLSGFLNSLGSKRKLGVNKNRRWFLHWMGMHAERPTLQSSQSVVRCDSSSDKGTATYGRKMYMYWVANWRCSRPLFLSHSLVCAAYTGLHLSHTDSQSHTISVGSAERGAVKQAHACSFWHISAFAIKTNIKSHSMHIWTMIFMFTYNFIQSQKLLYFLLQNISYTTWQRYTL